MIRDSMRESDINRMSGYESESFMNVFNQHKKNEFNPQMNETTENIDVSKDNI